MRSRLFLRDVAADSRFFSCRDFDGTASMDGNGRSVGGVGGVGGRSQRWDRGSPKAWVCGGKHRLKGGVF